MDDAAADGGATALVDGAAWLEHAPVIRAIARAVTLPAVDRRSRIT
jgi:hypothetical protein